MRPRRLGASSRVRRSPHPRPLPQERGPESSELALRLPIRRGRRRGPALRAGAWGRSPHRKKIRGWVGGPERRAAHAPPGWGCGGRLHRTRGYPAGPPTKDTRLPSRLGRSDPHLRPLPEGAGAGALSRRPAGDPAGAWGQSPHRRKIRGWVGGPERRAAHAPPGWGCGGGFTARGDTPQGPPRETRACPRGPQSGYVLAVACSARRAIARGRPSKMRRWIGQSEYQ